MSDALIDMVSVSQENRILPGTMAIADSGTKVSGPSGEDGDFGELLTGMIGTGIANAAGESGESGAEVAEVAGDSGAEVAEVAGEFSEFTGAFPETLVSGSASIEMPDFRPNDPGMSSVREYLAGGSDVFDGKDLRMLQKLRALIGVLEASEPSVEGFSNQLRQAEPLKSITVDPQVYASLMEKAREFVSLMKGPGQFPEELPLTMVENFDELCAAMKLRPQEKRLFGKAIAIAFMGAENARDGMKKLVSMLDISDASRETKTFRLYSAGPIKVEADHVPDVSDLEARDSIARLALPERHAEKGEIASKLKSGETQTVFPDKLISFGMEKTENVDQKGVEVLAPRTVDVENLVEELGGKLSYIARKNGGEVRLKLYPESLGELFMKVSTQKDGVQLKIVAATTEARSLLEARLPQLRENLNSQNLTLSKVEIDVDSGDAGRDHSGYAFNSEERFDDGRYRFSSGTKATRLKTGYGTNAPDLRSYGIPIERYGNRYNFVA